MKMLTCGESFPDDLPTHTLLFTKVMDAYIINYAPVPSALSFWCSYPETLIE